jgi:hypothetical protein
MIVPANRRADNGARPKRRPIPRHLRNEDADARTYRNLMQIDKALRRLYRSVQRQNERRARNKLLHLPSSKPAIGATERRNLAKIQTHIRCAIWRLENDPEVIGRARKGAA